MAKYNSLATLRLPLPVGDVVEELKIRPNDWQVLIDAIFPSAKTREAIILALRYCKAKNWDIFTKPVHIVPMWHSHLQREVETIWPGIQSLAITASRTGSWGGNGLPVYGPKIKQTFEGEVRVWDGGVQKRVWVSKTVEYHETITLPVYRFVEGQRCEFSIPVLWKEIYSHIGSGELPNEMWTNRPVGQHQKCALAASLRLAFPEVGQLTAEEMEGKIIDGTATEIAAVLPPTTESPTPNPAKTAPAVDVETESGQDEKPSVILEQLSEPSPALLGWIDRVIERARTTGNYRVALDYTRAQLSDESFVIARQRLLEAEEMSKRSAA